MSDILKHLLELWKQETNPETKKQLLHLVNEQMQNEQKIKMLETEQKVFTMLPDHSHISVEGGSMVLDKLDKANKLRLTVKGNSKVTIGKETVQPVPAVATPAVNRNVAKLNVKSSGSEELNDGDFDL